MDQWSNRRVLVMGLGSFGGGATCARWLRRHGADVCITDLRESDELAEALADPEVAACTLALGGHERADFESADVVVVNPAVPHPWDNPFLEAARAAGTMLTTEIRLVVERIDRSRVIGITGTAGKSTTAAMTHHLLEHAGSAAVFGGNIGGSLLDELDTLTPETWIVLELSSAQLHWLDADDHWAGWSPGVAAITNIAPNHLDWHGDAAHYARSKAIINAFQRPGDVFLRGEDVDEADLGVVPPVLGAHNRANAALAIAIVERITGRDRGHLEDALATFRGLPHRLCPVGDARPPRFVDDSKSTTPEAALMAIGAFSLSTHVHLIAGGYDKGVPLEPLARRAADLAGMYTIGATGPALAGLAGEHAVDCGTLENAVSKALSRMGPDDVLLLSPGCASWDQFPDFRARGKAFVRLVEQATT